ncbi:hypothetical protein HBI56_211330 [Parastagonospora nodorum]|uniref:Uncharacterized protein n=1 Tax=Phaeosphaeria nodorum (strain SN15 / ATCC MYA-4574 / FGSC 10173) TaxID=321614 RepID=A0A7U2I3C7_PHANO|nr:hypothetical protein HBH56_213040 [Parastagonospora nodorum]QRC97887.1 hypothetical protein JI435_152230 [Parastagonospora nodorum SN15]KAH3923110.1 hypothetical protein HBH54_214710 [Parastagonospora nodorum]KAH3941778.1 hypothetical protein HBH53_197380 [Parastagonospora nodorum]KAH3961017.1 hypothetical protein HBH51_187200 [Parastagonospora nodorum]
MQFTVVTLVTLFAAAFAAPSDVSARQATLFTLNTFSDRGCQPGSATGSVTLTNQATCKDLPAGINSGKILDAPRAGCEIVFYVGAGCPSGQTYTWPTNNAQRPDACFTLGGPPNKPLGSYKVQGRCA